MPQFYTVDRSGLVAPGQVLDTKPVHAIQNPPFVPGKEYPDEIVSLLGNAFPGGLSRHGERYLIGNYDLMQNGYIGPSHVVELATELIRKAQFPHMPSRMTCLYASETLDGARTFATRCNVAESHILLVEAAQFHRLDMHMLSLGPTIASSMNILTKYWQGAASSDPFWEILIHGPVQVISRVNSVDSI